MKVLVVLCAVVASCLAKPYVAYSAPSSYSYSTSVVSVSKPAVAYSPLAYSTPALYAAPAVYAAAPAVVPAPAPAPVAYAAAPAPAPAVVPAPAPAPVVYAAPAPAVLPAPAPAPVAYAAAPAVVAAPAPVIAPAVKSQYHAQNEAGEASYGHAEPGQTHNAVQDAHGNKVGSFSYVNPEGQVLRTDYVADGAGYRVASNALPTAPIVAPIDTPEVAAAKANFFHAYAAKAAGHSRRRRSAVLVQTPASTSPLNTYAPVVYSAPVAYAAAPATYSYAAPAPLAYAAPASLPYAAPASLPYAAPAPAVYAAPAAPAVIPATLTTVVNNPGHAVSYRVD